MARMHYRDPTSGTWVPISTQGPPGPTAVSTDANNTAVLGTDSLVFVPAPAPPVLDHGGLTGLADDDHPHYYNQTRGDARYALTGHSHGASVLPADLAPPAIGAASVLGTSTDYAREDHTHSGVQLASGAPPALTPDIVGAVGAGTAAARDNHVHNVPAAAPVANLTASTTNAEGTGASFARNDHAHAITANVAASPLGAAGAVGTSAALARADHVHIYPTAANVGADATGTASTAVTDHASAADPHTGYQRETEKGAVNGYASLGADGLVPATQLPVSEGGGGASVTISSTAPTSPTVGQLWATP